LEKLAAKGLDEAGEEQVKKVVPKAKKPKSKPRDSTTARGATPAESVGHLLQKKTFSRKINYDAVKNLFKGKPTAFVVPFASPFSRAIEALWEDRGEEVVGVVDDEEKDDAPGLEMIDPDPDQDQDADVSEYYGDDGYEEEV